MNPKEKNLTEIHQLLKELENLERDIKIAVGVKIDPSFQLILERLQTNILSIKLLLKNIVI